jgi:hypothetical protein
MSGKPLIQQLQFGYLPAKILETRHPAMIVHLSGGLEAGLASDQGHVHRRRGQSH